MGHHEMVLACHRLFCKEGPRTRLVGRVQTHFGFVRQFFSRRRALDEKCGRLDRTAIATGVGAIQRYLRAAKVLTDELQFTAAKVGQLPLRLAVGKIKSARLAIVAFKLHLIIAGPAMAQVQHVASLLERLGNGGRIL